MLFGDKEKTVKLHVENFLWGNITFDYGMFEEERQLRVGTANDFGKILDQWAKSDETDNKSEEHKKLTEALYHAILRLRAKGRITGILKNVDLEQRIEELVREKAVLQDEVKQQKELGLKALNELKDLDRTIAGLEAQIFYLKKK